MNNSDDEDKDLFKNAMRGVKQFKQSKVAPLLPKPKAIIRKPELEKENLEPILETLETVRSDTALSFHRPGISYKILRNLRRGQYNVDATIDLHGLTIPEAKKALHEFLTVCFQESQRHLLIIHGKGRKSGYPVLKNKVNQWLRALDIVLAFSSATAKDGDTGSLYVLLKNKKRSL